MSLTGRLARQAVIAAAAGLLLPGALSSAETREAVASVRVVGSALKVRPTGQPRGAATATIFAARNEFESFQVVVEAGNRRLHQISVSLATPLAQPSFAIPRRNVTIYREGYYHVSQASDSEGAVGRWPDSLIPAVDPFYRERRNAFPFDVPAGENRVAWVDILVPRNAPVGTYKGLLDVRGRNLRVQVPVHLTVLKLTLPSTATLTSAFGMSQDSACHAAFGSGGCPTEEQGWALNALYARAALDDRITISSPQYGSVASDSDRALFRRFTLPLLEGTAHTRLRGALLTAFQVDKTSLGRWKQEAKAGGFAGRAFVYACDEPNRLGFRWEGCKRTAAAARAIWPNLSVLVTANLADAVEFGAESSINVLVLIVNDLDNKPGRSGPTGNQRAAYDAFLHAPDRHLWLYSSCESHGCSDGTTDDPYYTGWVGYSIDAPASEARAMGWLSFRNRTSGELYWAVDHKLETAWSDQFSFGGNGDGTLFYPGNPSVVGGKHPIPIESLRLKLIRDGYEDYEYMRFLARHGKGRQALAVANHLFPTAYSTNRGDREVQAARRRLGKLVAAVAGGPAP